jgi:hypothetical protein
VIRMVLCHHVSALRNKAYHVFRYFMVV